MKIIRGGANLALGDRTLKSIEKDAPRLPPSIEDALRMIEAGRSCVKIPQQWVKIKELRHAKVNPPRASPQAGGASIHPYVRG
jgi:hypothetical protein